MRREKAPRDGRRPRLCTASFFTELVEKSRLGRATRFTLIGKTKPTGESRRVGDRDVRGRFASNHEKDENSLAGWTGPPKRIRRRETLGSSIVSVQSRKTSTGMDFRGEARKSRRDLVGNARTRVHEFFSSVLMAVAGGAHLACAKGREARADASCSRNSVVVDATPEDRAAKGCDAGVAISQTGDRCVCDRRVERSAEVHTATGVLGLYSPPDLHRSDGRRA